MHLKIKTTQCAGCHVCSLACAFQKAGDIREGNSGIRVMHERPRRLKTTLRFCIQCRQEYCIKICPKGALKRNKKGYVELDGTLCDRCGGDFKCVRACKYGAMYINADKTAPVKCDLCGGDPVCIDVCPEKIINLSATPAELSDAGTG